MIWKYENALNEIHLEETGIREWRKGTYMGVLYLMGISKYLMGWLKTMHLSPMEVAELLCDCMPDLLKKYFE